MEIKIEKLNGWENSLRMARYTVNKSNTGKEPSSEWKKRMLLSEHSPIREVRYLIQFEGIKTWAAQHIARHDFGTEHHSMDCAAVQYGATQRTDRTGVSRDELFQAEPTNHSMTCNTQDLINISRKRLCVGSASKETREAWEQVKEKMKEMCEETSLVMVRECVYRGFCPESKCCGFTSTKQFNELLTEYRK